MGIHDDAWRFSLSRRRSFRSLAALLSASPLVRAQQDAFRDHSRVPRLDELQDAFDFEAVAHAKLPRYAYDYTAYGSESEFTLRRNREAFQWVEITKNPNIGAMTQTATKLLGTDMPFPILISPSAAHAQLHPDAELATRAGASAAAQTPMIVSNVSSLPYEKIAASTTAKNPLWFQLYPKPELDANREVLEGVQQAGCKAIVVTIDQQASYFERALHDRNLNPPANRRTSMRSTVSNPYRVNDTRLFYEWKLFDQLRPIVKVPLIAKGILTGEDAKLCIEHGLDAVYVSNHGGRSLDYAPSTLEVLPEIVDAVQGKVPVLFDSGIRRGEDILKALALGASAVCLGRVPRWGLGAYGAAGVTRVLQLLQAELHHAMLNSGRITLASIDKTIVRTDFR